MNKEFICDVICNVKKCQENQVTYSCVPSNGMNFKQLRDLLVNVIKITEENEEDNYYLGIVEGGASSFSNAFMAIGIDKENIYIASYAEEGFIKQKIAENNIKKVINCLAGLPVKKSLKINVFVVISCVCVFSLIVFSFRDKQKIEIEIPEQQNQDVNVVAVELDADNIQELINGYNTAVENYNNIAREYNEVVSRLSIINIDNLRKSANEKEYIDAKKLNDTTVINMTEQIQQEIEELLTEYSVIYKLDNLSEDEIVEAVQTIQNVVSVSPVTMENDPNKLLEKENGYISCVYFSLDIIEQNGIPGKTTIEKGTDCGGCVELYKNVEDAENRVEYLAQFDNSLLYSGSYAIVGKMVVRTSYLLDNQQQIKITKQIVNSIIG